jgi:pimeloyl-ACP methyl ester carboxylesterase
METAATLRAPDGVKLAYRLARAPKTRGLIVLIHGLASNMTRWSEFVEHTALANDWDILRIDLRGHGESMTRGHIGMDEWCRDLAAILEHEHYREAYLVGNCLGANIALQFAARYPDKTAGLVLVEPILQPALAGTMKRLQLLKPLFRLAIWLIRLLNSLGLYRRRLPSLDLRRLDEDTRAAVAAGGNTRIIVSRYSAPWYDLLYLPSANYLQFLLEVVRPPPPLAAIKVPTLTLISLGTDFSDPVITQQLVGAIPRSRVVVIESRHWMMTEKPDEARRAIEQWFAEIAPSGRVPSQELV